MKLKIIGFVALALVGFTSFLGIEMLKDNNKFNNSLDLKSYEKLTDGSVNCENRNIYGTMSISRNWVIDPTDTKRILTELDNVFLVKARVTSIEKPLFLNTTKDNPNPYPVTPVNISLNKVLLGKDIGSLEKVYMTGGKVTIAETMKTLSQSDIEKLEYDKLPTDALNYNYIDYISDCDYELTPSNEYVFILLKQNDNTYQVLGNGHGVFQQENIKLMPNSNTKSDTFSIDENKIVYNNVLSHKELVVPNN